MNNFRRFTIREVEMTDNIDGSSKQARIVSSLSSHGL